VSDNVKSEGQSKEFRLFLLLLQAILNQSILHQLPLERMAHSNQLFKFDGQFELCFGTVFFLGFSRVFCIDKTRRRLFISCYVLEVFLECVFGVVVLPCVVVGEWL